MTAVDLKVSQSCVGSENHILRVELSQRDFGGFIGMWKPCAVTLDCG